MTRRSSPSQECVTLIQKLCTGVEEADKLVHKFTVSLTNMHSDKEVMNVTNLAFHQGSVCIEPPFYKLSVCFLGS